MEHTTRKTIERSIKQLQRSIRKFGDYDHSKERKILKLEERISKEMK